MSGSEPLATAVLAVMVFGSLFILRARAAAESIPDPDTVINIQYPYVASPARAEQIRRHYTSIAPGWSPVEIISLLGEPDEIRPLYEAKYPKAKRIGTTYWYFLAKPSERNDRTSVVRVSLDLNRTVTKVDQWGF